MLFKEFTIDEKILQGIEDVGFERCMPVQEQSYIHTLEGRDILVQSQTGSGKTAAFVLPILQKWVASEGTSKALILAPTRELVSQIEEEVQLLGAFLDIKSVSIFGGVGYQHQEKALSQGVDVIIATPGRLQDFVKQKKIDLREITQVVIDEADRLFDMGFYPDIQQIMKWCLPKEERQTMLYSATLSIKVRNLAWEFMNNPVELEIEPEVVTVDTIDQVIYHVSSEEKLPLLLGILKKESPQNAIIFCNTKRQAEIIAKRMELNGYHAQFLMGDLPQRKRLQIIKQVKEGTIPFLVATDVAARGLHVDDLELVINYDIPEDPENYVHRIGRTARAGKSGKAITFGCDKYVFGLGAVESYIGNKIPVEWADSELFVEDKSKGQYIETFQDRNRGGQRSGGDSRSRNSRGGRGERGGDRRDSRGGRDRRDSRDSRERRDSRDSRDRRDSYKRDNRFQGGDYKNNLRTMSEEERKAYYQQKYGESFGVDAPKEQKPKSGNQRNNRNNNRNNQHQGKRPEGSGKHQSQRGKNGSHKNSAHHEGASKKSSHAQSGKHTPAKQHTRQQSKQTNKQGNAQPQGKAQKSLLTKIKRAFGGK